MKLVDELFKRYILIDDTLIKYGFIKKDNIYSYNKPIHDNEFELQISIKNKIINAKLIDKEFNDEYSQINVESSGTFITSLKEECCSILIDIRNNCFIKQYFIYPQSNRITELIKQNYNIEPEFLWEKYPGFGIFRNKNNDKWFALIGNISKDKFIKGEKEEIEFINLKFDDKTNDYLNNKGIYPAYHMSKKNWVSIILDDTLSDNELIELINISYNNSNN